MKKNIINKIWLSATVALLFMTTFVVVQAKEITDDCIEHIYTETVIPATFLVNGEKILKCDNCGEEVAEIINKISSVKLSSSKVTYNGKVRTPSVIVTDSNDNKLIEDVDYTVSYDKGRKLPGIYTITVYFIGEYSGEQEMQFTIAPKATTGIKSEKKTSTSITLTWSKTTGATGYRIYQYSSNKGKYVLKKSVKETTYKVTGLRKGTSYKFKVKPYTKAEDGTIIWGSSSSVYTTKTTQGYKVEISGSSATLYVGGTKKLKATTTPANQSVTWKSSNTSVASVSSSGKVTATKEGTTTITVTFKYKGDTYTDTYKITVKPTLSVDKSKLTIKAGTTKKQVVTLTFKESGSARWEIVQGSELIICQWAEKWEDGNKIKLYVSAKGYGYGEAKIKIYSENNPERYTYVDVTVTPSSEPTVFVDKSSLTISAGSAEKHAVVITFREPGRVFSVVESGGDLIDTYWGDEWHNDTIKLYVAAKGNHSGEAKIKIYAEDDPSKYTYIYVTVKGEINGNISDAISKPIDNINDIKRFVSSYYSGDCYALGNFRLIFNSANGVILSWGATNTSSKEIKYITFTIKYYNRVGDPAYDSITGKSSHTVRITGPIGAGKSFYLRKLIGYGDDIYYGVITDVKIEYMDGSVVSGNYGYTTWHNIRTGASPKECLIIEE